MKLLLDHIDEAKLELCERRWAGEVAKCGFRLSCAPAPPAQPSTGPRFSRSALQTKPRARQVEWQQQGSVQLAIGIHAGRVFPLADSRESPRCAAAAAMTPSSFAPSPRPFSCGCASQVFALAEALQSNIYVTDLNLSYNAIDDAGAAVIAKLLKARSRGECGRGGASGGPLFRCFSLVGAPPAVDVTPP